MPSRDASGRRLSGSEQKAQAALRRAGEAQTTALARRKPDAGGGTAGAGEGLPIPFAFLDIQKPPTAGVAAVELWAAGVNLRAAVAGESADDEEAPRVIAVVALCREIGKIRAKAGEAEKLLRLRELRLHVPAVVSVDSPPVDDAVAAVLWAMLKLAAMTYRAARDPEWLLDARFGSTIKALAGAGYLTCLDEHEEVVRRIDADEE